VAKVNKSEFVIEGSCASNVKEAFSSNDISEVKVGGNPAMLEGTSAVKI